jgi:hypothetical protein
VSDDLDSANEKLEFASNEYTPVSLTRHECEALIQEHNEMGETICDFERKELRMEWPILLLVFLVYYLSFKFFATHAEISLKAWAAKEYGEMMTAFSNINL